MHVDVKYLPQMPDYDQRNNLDAAVDRTTPWVYVEHRSARSASSFLLRLIDTAPFHYRSGPHRQRHIAAVSATARSNSAEHLANTGKRYVRVYNQHIPRVQIRSTY